MIMKYFSMSNGIHFRIVLDVELSITSGARLLQNQQDTTVTSIENDLEIKKQIQKELLLVVSDQEEFLSISKLSKPVWPKTPPTIPSALFKNDYCEKVKQQSFIVYFVYFT